MARLAPLPGIAPLLACAALLAAWELAARAIGIDGLPPASQALAQVPRELGARLLPRVLEETVVHLKRPPRASVHAVS